MKVIHVVPYVTQEASGLAYAVPQLCRALGAVGCDVTLMTIDEEPLPPSEGFRHEVHPRLGFPRRFFTAPDLERALRARAAEADLLHNHCIWAMPNVYTGRLAKETGIPLVNSPRGTLAPAALAHRKRLKQIFWHLYQNVTFEQTGLLHATAEHEYEHIRGLQMDQPVMLISDGIAIPDIAPAPPPPGPRVLLFLGRLHPIKGLPLLLEVWRDLPAEKRAGWELRLVGPGEKGHEDELKTFCSKHGLADVMFPGPLFAEDKYRAFADADLFVLPTHGENFGGVVAEALACRTPVITTKGAPWSGLEEHRCGWWIERDHATLTATLVDAMSRPRAELDRMGEAGREWVSATYGWEGFARSMISGYEWLLGGCKDAPPDCVRLD